MPKTLEQRLALLEALEVTQQRQQVDAGVYIPEGDTAGEVFRVTLGRLQPSGE